VFPLPSVTEVPPLGQLLSPEATEALDAPVLATEPDPGYGSFSIEDMSWWAWLLIVVGVVALGLVIAFRAQLRFAMRVTKSVATDDRLPRPLRGAIGIGLAIKVIPVPDFGIDEIILVVCGTLLLTVYRPTLQAILAETRATEPSRHTPLVSE
jgi:hypothetical protein